MRNGRAEVIGRRDGLQRRRDVECRKTLEEEETMIRLLTTKYLLVSGSWLFMAGI